MKMGRDERGYTIIETLLFVAISGFMFVVAGVFLDGRQARAEFRQGINALNSQITAVINDVGNGYYPSNNNFSCQADIVGNAPVINAGGSQTQGSNRDCVFMGKVIHFGVNGSLGVGYNIYSMAGRQYKTTPLDSVPTKFSEAKPVVIRQGGFDTADKRRLEWGVRVTKVTTTAPDINGDKPLSGIAFFSSFGTYGTTNTLSSGSQSTVVIPVAGSLDESEDSMINTDVAASVNDAGVDAAPNIIICLDDNSGERFGTIIIGGNSGQRLSSTLKTYTHKTGLPAVCQS